MNLHPADLRALSASTNGTTHIEPGEFHAAVSGLVAAAVPRRPHPRRATKISRDTTRDFPRQHQRKDHQ